MDRFRGTQQTLALAVTCLVGLWLVLDLLMVWSANATRNAAISALEAAFAGDASGASQLTHVTGLLALLGLFELGTSLMLIASYIVFMIWFRTSYRVASSLSSRRLPWSVEWATWGWLIPIFAWVMAWQVLDGMATVGDSSGMLTRRDRSRLLLLLWAVPQAFAAIAWRTSLSSSGTGLLGVLLLNTVSGISLILLVRTVTSSMRAGPLQAQGTGA